jgi:hypothetical protein
MKLSKKEQLLVILHDAGVPIKGRQIREAWKLDFNLDTTSGEVSRVILASEDMFTKEGESRNYSYALTPAGQNAARTIKAMMSKEAPIATSDNNDATFPNSGSTLARQIATVILDNGNTPMMLGDITRAVNTKFGKQIASSDIGASIIGTMKNKRPMFVKAGERGQFTYAVLPGVTPEILDGEAGVPRKYSKSQWTLTLVNGTQQFAASISTAVAKRIVNSVLFKSDSEELN